MTGVIWCAMYIGHLHRSQCMAETRFRSNSIPVTSTMTVTEFTMEVSETVPKMHFESPAQRCGLTIEGRNAREEQSDTQQMSASWNSQTKQRLCN